MINLFNNFYKLKISGCNIKRFLKYLNSRKVEIYDIDLHKDYAYIKVNKDSYEIINNIKTIYEIELVELYGLVKIKDIIHKYNIFLWCLGIGFALLIVLSNMILSVEVVHNKSKIRKVIYQELEELGIKKYQFFPSFNTQEEIVDKIINNHKDLIEWMEIERVGVKYIVRVEERIINPEKEIYPDRHIVALKNGMIIDIIATKGSVVKKQGEYVKKGDIIISGHITKGDKIMNSVSATGKVYAETWYQVTVEVPLTYKEIIKTGRSKKTFTISFLNNSFNLLDFSKYKNKNITESILLKDNLIPFKISFNNEEEITIIDEVYTLDKALSKASLLARNKLLLALPKDSRILDEKSLNIEEKDSTIKVVLFFKVYENITEYSEIKMEEINSG